MEKFIAVVEKGENGYSAFSPDLPGCTTVGDTFDETIMYMKEAITLYLEALMEDGEEIPQSKGLKHHIDSGIFNENEIAEEYYIAQVEIHRPNLVA